MKDAFCIFAEVHESESLSKTESHQLNLLDGKIDSCFLVVRRKTPGARVDGVGLYDKHDVRFYRSFGSNFKGSPTVGSLYSQAVRFKWKKMLKVATPSSRAES